LFGIISFSMAQWFLSNNIIYELYYFSTSHVENIAILCFVLCAILLTNGTILYR
jgi:hypothetical protein